MKESIKMEKYDGSLQILTMPNWKAKILNTVAWLLGIRGENVYCITLNIDLDKINRDDIIK